MLKVKTTIGPSEIHGIGLFADEIIPAGTVTWEFSPTYDKTYTREEVDQLPDYEKERFFDYTYFDKELNLFVLPFDDLRFINHSTHNPNIQSTPRKDTALRDIQIGEELVCNYEDYEQGYFERRGIDLATYTEPK